PRYAAGTGVCNERASPQVLDTFLGMASVKTAAMRVFPPELASLDEDGSEPERLRAEWVGNRGLVSGEDRARHHPAAHIREGLDPLTVAVDEPRPARAHRTVGAGLLASVYGLGRAREDLPDPVRSELNGCAVEVGPARRRSPPSGDIRHEAREGGFGPDLRFNDEEPVPICTLAFS